MLLYRGRIPDGCSDVPRFLQSRFNGVFLLRLQAFHSHRRVINHSVAFDAKEQIIWDPAEIHGIRFCPDSLRACVGDNCTNFQVEEIRLIELQPQRESDKKKRRNDPERRKRQRHTKRHQA